MSRPIPMVGEVALSAVQRVRHEADGGFARLRVEGLPGELVQRHGRRSHVIEVEGVLTGETAKDDLDALQKMVAAGDEQVFTADIVTALDLQKVVIDRFVAAELAGFPGSWAFRLRLVESPPLPPPATLESGFGDFGLDDLGFDTDILGDIIDQAGAVAGAIDAAMDAVDKLQALAALAGGLSVGNPLAPLTDAVGGLAGPAGQAAGAVGGLVATFLGEGG